MIYDNASISRFASRRSAVPTPSVKQSHTEASRSRAQATRKHREKGGSEQRRDKALRCGKIDKARGGLPVTSRRHCPARDRNRGSLSAVRRRNSLLAGSGNSRGKCLIYRAASCSDSAVLPADLQNFPVLVTRNSTRSRAEAPTPLPTDRPLASNSAAVLNRASQMTGLPAPYANPRYQAASSRKRRGSFGLPSLMPIVVTAPSPRQPICSS